MDKSYTFCPACGIKVIYDAREARRIGEDGGDIDISACDHSNPTEEFCAECDGPVPLQDLRQWRQMRQYRHNCERLYWEKARGE